MKKNKDNLVLSFIVVMITFGLQLCFYENKAYAGGMTVTNFSPTDDSTNVPVNSDLVVTFDRAWQPGSDPHGFEIRRQDGSVFESFVFPTARITGEGTADMTINPTLDFEDNTNYYLYIGASTIVAHPSGAPEYLGITNSTTWNFTSGTGGGCYNPPSCIGPCFGNFLGIKHLSPPDNGHFMQSYEGLNIIFNGIPLVGTGNITIRRYSDDAILETIDVTSNKVTGWGTSSVNIDPSANLADNTQYYVNFDMEGYSLTTDKSKWNFWTKSTPNTFSGSGL